MAWFAERGYKRRAGQNLWWVAPVYMQAEIAYRRMKLRLLRGRFDFNDSKRLITLENGALLWFKSGEIPDNLYGEDVYEAVIDEASRVREASWIAIRSTMTATRGDMRIIGNVKGRANWFYKLCRTAEQGDDPEMAYYSLDAWDAVDGGILDRAEIESAQRQLPKNVFEELYLAKPSDDGGNPFGLNAIRQNIREISGAPVVAWGVDLAKSHDWTVAIGLDANGNVSALHRFQKTWMQTAPLLIKIIGCTPALVDSTGVGDPIVEQIQAECPNVEGFKFSQTSKQQIMEGLAVAIQQGTIGYPDGVIVDELETFEYEYTRTGCRYTAPAGLHDDTVCAIALAKKRQSTQVEGMGFFDYYKETYENRHQGSP
jgi:phage FluMu gp28-like protein